MSFDITLIYSYMWHLTFWAHIWYVSGFDLKTRCYRARVAMPMTVAAHSLVDLCGYSDNVHRRGAKAEQCWWAGAAMTNNSNEKKKDMCVGGREGGGGVAVWGGLGGCWSRLLALCVTFVARENQTFISSAREGSNVGLEILQLSGGECTIPSPVARSFYHWRSLYDMVMNTKAHNLNVWHWNKAKLRT